MKDLFRSLDDYPEEFHRALAETWDIDLPADEPLHRVLRLGEGMLAAGAVERIVQTLSPEALEALAHLAADGGASAGRTLAMRYGEVRRFGPAALRREQPWQEPSSPLEELYYRGLIYRAFGDLGDLVGELFVIPDQLLARLPALEPPSFRNILIAALPTDELLCQGDTLVEDVMAEIVHLRQQPIRLPASSGFPAELAARLDLGARLSGPSSSERMHLLWRLLTGQDLVEHDGRQWHLSLRARQWLGQPDADQWLACYIAWRDDRTWDELYDLPGIICDRSTCPNEPWGARKRLCSHLEGLAEEQWYELDSFVAALRQVQPDYLRPDGDMDSWLVRDAASGEFLRGMSSWEAIEGALARYLVTGPLHWLGIVDLGTDAETHQIFRISAPGSELLSELPPHIPDDRPGAPLAVIDARLQVTIDLRNSRYQRYQLERLAEWRRHGEGQARYQLSEDSVWQAENAGITTDQMLTFLRRITNDRLPEIAMRTLQAWGQRYGSASLRHAVLLETVDAATMQRIRKVPAIAALLGHALGATRCLVDEDNMERLIAELKRRNIWPRISR